MDPFQFTNKGEDDQAIAMSFLNRAVELDVERMEVLSRLLAYHVAKLFG